MAILHKPIQRLLPLVFLSVVSLAFSSVSARAADTRMFEMRVYFAAPGKLPDLQARFRNHTLDLFKKHGIENIGYWTPINNSDNKLVYILAYPSREARQAPWKAFGADREWNRVAKESEANGKLVTKVDSTFMSATDFSPKMEPSRQDPPRVFELRTYTTHEGRLPNLLKRFREHTVKLFEKHDMTNVAYWTPVEKPNTLIYMLAHKSEEAAKKSWAAFRADPVWVAAKKASEDAAGGSLTVDNGVKSEFLVPADYSPTK